MTEKSPRQNKNVRRQKQQFYFQHSEETRMLSDQLRAKENLEFAGFVRRMFNAGLKASYGIDMVDNKPVLPENMQGKA